MAMASAIGVGAALLIAALLSIAAGSRGRDPARSYRTFGAFGAGVVYLIFVVPFFAATGVQLWSVVVMAIVAAIPGVVASFAAARVEAKGERRVVSGAASVIAGLALLIAVLTAAGEILSLVGGVDHIVGSAGVGVVCVAYLMRGRIEGPARTSRWLFGVLIALAVIVVALGAVGGQPAHLAAATVPVDRFSVGALISLAMAVAALALADPVLAVFVGRAPNPRRTGLAGAALVVIVVLLTGLGLLALYSGSFQAPSLQFFALIQSFPVVATAVIVAVAAFMAAATTDSLLACTADKLGGNRELAIAGIGIVAIAVAAALPGTNAIVVTAAIVTVALALAGVNGDGVGNVVAAGVGIAASFIYAGFAGFADVFEFGTRAAIAIAIAGVVSMAVSRGTWSPSTSGRPPGEF